MNFHDQAMSLLERAVELLERMDPARRGDRPAATDAEFDALHRDLHRFVYEERLVQLSIRMLQMYSPAQASVWVHCPQALLGGRSADEMIAEGRWQEVDAAVSQLLDGVYL